MKKIVMILFALAMTITASAQFEKGKIFCGASLSGLDLSYSGERDLHFGLDAKGGYCLVDNWMATAQVGLDTNKDATSIKLSVGGRYYIIQNGIFLGANVAYKHNSSYNDVMPGVEVGYAFFVNRHCTIEPAIYYDQSLKSHKDYSTIGIRVGIGIYM